MVWSFVGWLWVRSALLLHSKDPQRCDPPLLDGLWVTLLCRGQAGQILGFAHPKPVPAQQPTPSEVLLGQGHNQPWDSP